MIAGLDILRVINEPTAAAIPYNLDIFDARDHYVVVYDLGATFEVSLLNLDSGLIEIAATAGDVHLGGDEFDRRIVTFLADSYNSKNNVDITKDVKAMTKLAHEVEKAKHILSNQTSTHIEIESFFAGRDFSETLTRAEFEELNMDLFKQTFALADQVFKEAGVNNSAIDGFLLVSGGAHIPKVQHLVQDYFHGKTSIEADPPDEATSFGAAVHAGLLSGAYFLADCCWVGIDVSPLSLGIETPGGRMTALIPRNTPIPVRQTGIFSTAADNQTAVVVQVFEGERAMAGENNFLGAFELAGIPPAPRGVPQIEVAFEVDANGGLQVFALDKGTGRRTFITIHNDGRLPQDEIDHRIMEAERFALEDGAIRQRIESNRLEEFSSNWKSQVNEGGGNSHVEL